MKKQQHGGRRKNQTGRPPKPKGEKLYHRPVGLLPAQWQWLKDEAERNGVSVSEIIRRLVKQAAG